MNKLGSIPGRALELASSVGDNLKHAVPAAGKWLETGAKLGVLKSGAKVAGTFVRRNPVIAVAAVAGAGLLWYAAHRRAKRAANGEGEAIEGSAKRIDARRAKGNGSHKRTTRKRNEAGSTTQ